MRGDKTLPLRLKTLALPAVAIVLALAAAVHTLSDVSHTSGRYATYDFSDFYAWGLSYRHHQQIWTNSPPPGPAIAEMRPPAQANYTPFFVASFAPLTFMKPQPAHTVWIAIQVVSLALAIILLGRSAVPPMGAWGILAFLALALLSRSFYENMLFGQSSPLLLLLMTASWYCANRRRNSGAGISLALATLLKLYPGLIGVYFLMRRSWKVVLWAAMFFVVGVVSTGPADWYRFLYYGLPRSRVAMARFLPDRVSILNLVYFVAGRFDRIVGSAALLTTAIIDLALILILARTTIENARRDDQDSLTDGLIFGLWLAAELLVSPLSWHHEMPLLVPLYFFASVAIFVSFGDFERSPRVETSGLLGAVLIAACIGREFVSRLNHWIPRFLVPLIALVAGMLLLRARDRDLTQSRAGIVSNDATVSSSFS